MPKTQAALADCIAIESRCLRNPEARSSFVRDLMSLPSFLIKEDVFLLHCPCVVKATAWKICPRLVSSSYFAFFKVSADSAVPEGSPLEGARASTIVASQTSVCPL